MEIQVKSCLISWLLFSQKVAPAGSGSVSPHVGSPDPQLRQSNDLKYLKYLKDLKDIYEQGNASRSVTRKSARH